MTTPTGRSQLELLSADTSAISIALNSTPDFTAKLADASDPDRHAPYLVVTDITWRIWHQAKAVATLLEEGLFSPALTIARSSFESLATLAYLVKHPRKQDESVILLAFSFVRELEHSPDDGARTPEIKSILARMPPRLVEIAQMRAKNRPKTWSGETIRKMAEMGGVKGYDVAYAWLSSEAHGSAMGHHAKVTPAGDGMMRIHLGREFYLEDVESTANFARRALHSAFKILWAEFDLPKVKIPVPDPEKWPLV